MPNSLVGDLHFGPKFVVDGLPLASVVDDATTLSIMTLSIMTLSIMTLSKLTLSMMTLSIMTLSIMVLFVDSVMNAKRCK